MQSRAHRELNKAHTGSGSDTRSPEPRYLVVGQITSIHGLRGEVKVRIMTDFPDRFKLLKTVYLGDEARPYELEGFRLHRKGALLKLAGCDDRNTAEKLRGQLVQIPIEEALPLSKDEYYVYQIEGLGVWTTDGQWLGVIREVLFTNSNEVYVVENDDGSEILIPAISQVVQEVDVDSGHLIVKLMEGMR